MARKPIRISNRLDPDDIRRKLALVRERVRGGKSRVFGSEAHHNKLAEPLSPKQIAALEKRHGLSLPEDFRVFLTQLGDGGAGPYYGIHSLQKALDSPRIKKAGIARAFPHSRAWNMPKAWFAKRRRLIEAVGEADERGELTGSSSYETALQEHEDEYWSPEQIEGALPICEYGCGSFFLLVVTGKEQGTVWFDCRIDDGGVRPIRLDLSVNCGMDANWCLAAPGKGRRGKVTFAAWYNVWLERVVRKLQIRG